MNRWSITIPISGAVHFTMISDEEPSFDEALEHHSKLPAKEVSIEWEYAESMHGEGSAQYGHMYDCFETELVEAED